MEKCSSLNQRRDQRQKHWRARGRGSVFCDAGVFSTSRGVGRHRGGNIVVATVAIAISLFSVSGAMQNMIKATNATYSVKETRNIIKLRVRSFFADRCRDYPRIFSDSDTTRQ
jgi:hypothetical protein